MKSVESMGGRREVLETLGRAEQALKSGADGTRRALVLGKVILAGSLLLAVVVVVGAVVL